MAKKSDVKICRCADCHYPEKIIDTTEDEYVVVNKRYFHSDCYDEMCKAEESEAKLKADIQLIKNMWIENVSDTVVYSQLYMEINRLIRERGISSEYIIFVLDYCIKNKCKLRYPAGLKYYVDKQEIKDAYAKKEAKKVVGGATFKIDETAQDDSPKFTVNKKPSGFNSILGRR